MIKLNNNQKIIIIIIGIIVIGVVGYYVWTQAQEYQYEEIEETQELSTGEEIKGENNTKEQEIIIHIAGAVENEGIIKLKEESRIADAIEMAGGLTIEADIKNVNLAQKVQDGQKIYIPEKGEEIETNIETKEMQNDNQKININTATQTQLETLSGIGPSTAQKIIEYRNKNGKFEDIEEIKNVSGIGESKYESIKEDITV